MSQLCNCGNNTNDPDGICAMCRFKSRLPGDGSEQPRTVANNNKTGGDIMAGIAKEKTCVDCKKPYEPTGNRQERCPDCKEEHLKAKQSVGGGRKKKKKRGHTKRQVQEPASPGELTVEGSLGRMVRKAQTLISEIKDKCAELERLFGSEVYRPAQSEAVGRHKKGHELPSM